VETLSYTKCRAKFLYLTYTTDNGNLACVIIYLNP